MIYYKAPPRPSQMETEPVCAIEPALQTANEAPLVQNSSSVSQLKTDAHSGTLTSEQLEAIEEEEILDKMVLWPINHCEVAVYELSYINGFAPPEVVIGAELIFFIFFRNSLMTPKILRREKWLEQPWESSERKKEVKKTPHTSFYMIGLPSWLFI